MIMIQAILFSMSRLIFCSRHARATASAVLALLVAQGCATGVTDEAAQATRAAQADAPPQWRYGDALPAGSDPVTLSWWQSFGSTELDALVQRAREDNPGFAAAQARVAQARARRTIARAPLFPGVDANANAARVTGDRDTVSANSLALGLSVSYEVDLWGGNRAAARSADASLRSAAFERDGVALSLSSEVALAWMLTASLRERAAIAAQMHDNALRVLRVVEARHGAGSATSLELAQQRGLVASRERVLRELTQRANDSLAVLATLLGQSASGFDIAAVSLRDLREPSVEQGLPPALLVRRPDLAAAEARLAAAQADIAVARALMLPRLTLGAGASAESDRLHTLFENPAYSLAAGLLAPVFHAGRLEAGRDLAVAQREERVADYRTAIIAANAEVEAALNAIAGTQAQRLAQDEALVHARRAFALAGERYRAGAETLLIVLDTQRTLFEAEEAAAGLRLAGLQARVQLYKALGGGWVASQI